ncbi:MAG: hypothetical protein QOF73_3652 [Thermomicrobiales bacterium]|nr:hypothetical protein [Thermomicrobiales bacterium]
MNRRKLVVGGGASALTLAVAGLAAQRSVDAQDATPGAGTATPSTGTGGPDTTQNDAQTRYQDFVAALAANLGIADASGVDAAIRTTLKQLVDAEFAAGNISADEATARKERIDSSDSPLGLGGFGRHGGGPGGRDGKHRGRDDGDGGDDKPGGTEETETTPAAGATPTTV